MTVHLGDTLATFMARPPSKPEIPAPLRGAGLCHPCYWSRCVDCTGKAVNTNGQQAPCPCPHRVKP